MPLLEFIDAVLASSIGTPAHDEWIAWRERISPSQTLKSLSGGDLSRIVAALERCPELLATPALPEGLQDLYEDRGGELYLRYRLAAMSAALSRNPDPDSDDPREQYSELLEQHAGNPAALERLREFGRQLERLEAEERLPRTLMRRGQWRSPTD